MGNKAIVIGGLVVGVLFLAAIYRLLSLSYESGEAYPAYSSFRAGPMGTRALYDALASLDGISVQRNLSPIEKIGDGNGRMLLFAGSMISDDPESAVEALEAFALEGGRLVIAFSGEAEVSMDDDTKEGELGEDEFSGEEDSELEDPGEVEEDVETERESFIASRVSIAERWGFEYETRDFAVRVDGGHGEEVLSTSAADEALPRLLSWHSELYFGETDETWTTVYERTDVPVIMERRWGAGSIVLLSGSYHLSNEAMRVERNPEFLAWLMGNGSEIIFDESHLGVAERPGVVALAMRYRLGGVIAGLLLMTGLFIWKSVVSLAPKSDGPMHGPDTVGQGASAGLSNLLRRSVPKNDVLRMCMEEWERATPQGLRISEKARGELESVIKGIESAPARKRDPVEGYRRICTILSERKRLL